MDCPVLVTLYNRPNITRRLFRALEEVQPNRLFVASDGPVNDGNSAKLVSEVREIVATSVTWECEVKTLYNNTNLGCRVGMVTALDWFFSQVPEGVILEDDCIPHPNFFTFAEAFMDRYRDDKRVWGFSGDNSMGLPKIHRGRSLLFTRYPLIWGWASWADRWKKRDYDLSSYPSPMEARLTKNWPSRDHKHVFFRHLTDMTQTGLPNTWDYPWSWTVMKDRGLWLVPNAQLITNIGYGDDATNTKGDGPHGPPPVPLGSIIPAAKVEANHMAEEQILIKIHRLRRPSWKSGVRFTIRYLLSILRRSRVTPTALPGSSRERV